MRPTTTSARYGAVLAGILLAASAIAQKPTEVKGFGIRESRATDIRISQPVTTITGSLVASDPAHARQSGSRPFSSSCEAGITTSAGAYRYDVYPFQVRSAGIFTAQLNSSDFDPFLSLYCSFDPNNGADNLLASDDDGGPGLNSAFVAGDGIALVPGTTYFLVVTSFSAGVTGNYTLTIDPEVSFAPTRSECSFGPTLAATILYPYFEADLENPGGISTLLSANNWGPEPTINRVTVWNDWGKPTLAFDVYLESNDVQSFSVRDLLTGNIPATGVGADLSSFPGCVAQPPNGYPSGGPFSPGQLDQIRAYHTGVSGTIDTSCSGQPVGDGIARGYITIDNVRSCSGPEGFDPQATPASTDYQTTVLGNQNVLGGDLIIVEPGEASAQGYDPVHLAADVRNEGFRTFYGQYNGNNGIDRRNPLPVGANLRYLNGGPFGGGADILQWLSSESSDTSSVACGTTPPWYPNRVDVTAFDEEAGSQVTFNNTNRFASVTQRVPITAFSNLSTFGMIRLQNDVQSWSYVILKAGGIFSGGWSAVSEAADALCGVAP
ncbi:MAG TPA: hypothetical protein VMT85_02660 [Thermoanaerobaculia bacterium]|nr:hypothetical protein [Thermoanaerobaculia bacterium]